MQIFFNSVWAGPPLYGPAFLGLIFLQLCLKLTPLQASSVGAPAEPPKTLYFLFKHGIQVSSCARACLCTRVCAYGPLLTTLDSRLEEDKKKLGLNQNLSKGVFISAMQNLLARARAQTARLFHATQKANFFSAIFWGTFELLWGPRTDSISVPLRLRRDFCFPPPPPAPASASASAAATLQLRT